MMIIKNYTKKKELILAKNLKASENLAIYKNYDNKSNNDHISKSNQILFNSY